MSAADILFEQAAAILVQMERLEAEAEPLNTRIRAMRSAWVALICAACEMVAADRVAASGQRQP